MKYILLFFALGIVTTLQAQSDLIFNKRYVECEDKWVAFPPEEKGNYIYGFIYIDSEAGLTLNYEGNFTIDPSGKFVPARLDSTSIKVRLEPNNKKVAIIPGKRFSELQIQPTPDWLSRYKTDTGSIDRLYKWGFMYNGWGQCDKALTYLKQALEINKHYKNLLVELAFSYNCLGQYNDAIAVLQDALKAEPKNAYTNKELIYAQIKSGQLAKASESCRNAIAICTEAFNAENCYNLLAAYFQAGDKANFNLWVDETKKWSKDNETIMNNIRQMEQKIEQQ